MNTKYYIISLCLLLSALSSFGRKKCKLCRVSTVSSTPIQKAPELIEQTSYSSQPSDHSKTPTTLDFIYHGGYGLTIFGWKSNFYTKRIFFGEKITKKNNVIQRTAIYQTIKEHVAINPEFGKVMLAIYYPDKSGPNRFKIIGTYSDRKARKKLLQKMKKLLSEEGDGAVWCPEQNAIIARTMYSRIDDSLGVIKVVNYEIGKEFEQFLKNQEYNQ